MLTLAFRVLVWSLDVAIRSSRGDCPHCADMARQLRFEREQNEARGRLLGILKKAGERGTIAN